MASLRRFADAGDTCDVHPVIHENRRAVGTAELGDRFDSREQPPVRPLFLPNLDESDPDPKQPPRDFRVIVHPARGPVGDGVNGRQWSHRIRTE